MLIYHEKVLDPILKVLIKVICHHGSIAPFSLVNVLMEI
jgi:hypothetical protein